MIVLERLPLWGLSQLRRLRASDQSRKAVLLAGSRLDRLVSKFSRVEPLPETHRGKGRAVAYLLSVQVTEAFLAQGGTDSRAERALLTFFKDEQILQAYRKFLLQWVNETIGVWQAAVYEAQASECEKITFLPAAEHSARLLRCWRRVQRDVAPDAIEVMEDRFMFAVTRLRDFVYGCLAGVALLGRLLWLVPCQGITVRSPRPRKFLVALHNYWNVAAAAGRPWDLRSADFLVDGERVRREDLLVLISRQVKMKERVRQYREAGIAFASLFQAPLPWEYVTRLVPRVLKTVVHLWLPSGAIHPLLRRRTCGAILYGIRLESLLQHYAIGVLLNAEEDSYEAIVETVVLNKFGGATSWIPHTVVGGGYQMGYLHFDLLPLQGWFHVRTYGVTWSKRMRVKPVGIPTNDRIGAPDAELATEAARRLVEGLRRDAKVKVVGVFTGSYTPDGFVRQRYQRFLRILASLVERTANVRVVIKPKASTEWPEHSFFLFEDPFRSMIEAGVKDGTIFVLDPRRDMTCTAQYLMAVSDVVLSTGQHAAFGSAWVEAMLMGKPSYVFAPSEFRAAPFADQFFDRWIFDDKEKLVQAVVEELEVPHRGEIPGDIRNLFDPYNDGRAIERLRTEILGIVKPGFRSFAGAAPL